MVSATALAVGTLAATALSTAASVGTGIKQANEQADAANAQAKVARNNAQLAENQASAERRSGNEQMEIERRNTGMRIGKLRAAAGASGAAVDVGSNLDIQADTASSGEINAINAYNQGIDRAYNYEIQATNYRNQANAYDAQASSYRSAATTNALVTGLSGIASMGNAAANWAKLGAFDSETLTNVYYDNNAGSYVGWSEKSGKWKTTTAPK